MKTYKTILRYMIGLRTAASQSAPALLTAILLFANTVSGADAGETVQPVVEAALLQEDWGAVAGSLEGVDESTASPVLRLIKGHACLILNRNNESLCLFLTLTNPDDLEQCIEWSRDFRERHPGSPIGSYLYGDLLSRLGRREEAIAELSAALDADPTHLPARHSRAVLYATMENFEAAREDFKIACLDNPRFADLYASRGTYLIRKETDPAAAIRWFDEALAISPDYVLALNGRAAMLIVQGKLPEADEALEKTTNLSVGCLSSLLPVVKMNCWVLSKEVDRSLDEKLTEVAGLSPGMSLQESVSNFRNLDPATQQTVVNDLANARAFNDRRLGNSFIPSSISTSITGGLEASVLGPSAYLEGNLSTTWDNQATQHIFGRQDNLLSTLEQEFDVHPNLGATDNVGSFLRNQIGISRSYSHPGGVSSRGIGEGVDKGEWEAFTCFGLLYRIDAADKSTTDGGELVK